MSRSWRDHIPAMREQLAGRDNSDNSDVRPPNVPKVPIVTDGVKRLDPERPPFALDPKAWRHAVESARSLLVDGWALHALALGWSELDLFGVAAADDPRADGLAAWLQGRKLRALCGTWAVAYDANGNRFYHHRQANEGAVLLWELGGRER